MTVVKGIGRIGRIRRRRRRRRRGRRRRTQLLDYLRNIRRYWGLKEEAEDRKRWKRQ